MLVHRLRSRLSGPAAALTLLTLATTVLGCGADSTPAAVDTTAGGAGDVTPDAFIPDTGGPDTNAVPDTGSAVDTAGPDTNGTSDVADVTDVADAPDVADVPDLNDTSGTTDTTSLDTRDTNGTGDVADASDTSTSTCPKVTLTGPLTLDDSTSSYGLGFDGGTDLGFGGPAPDIFTIEIWDDAEGTFDLGSGDNADYLTCAQCVLVLVDLVGETPTSVYFQRSGTLTVIGLPSDGAPKFTLSDVTLGETDADLIAVTGGFCLSLADVALDVTVLVGPTDWTCDPEFYGDESCDCGCGIPDIDCPDATVNDCEYCGACESNSFGSCVGAVDPTDVTLCLPQPEPPAGWTCPPEWFGDDGCDCGCGDQDVDCATTTEIAECEYCLDCEGNGSCLWRVDATDTTTCKLVPVVLPDGWRCDAEAFGDGSCDCGCGAQDLDCPSTVDVEVCEVCDTCGTFGSCDLRVEPTDTTVCAANPPELPAGWSCFDTDYGDGWCDCGCGAQDIDCEATDIIDECDFCFYCEGDEACSAEVDPTDTRLCLP